MVTNIRIEFEGNSYVVKEPTTDDFLQIKTLKQLLSRNQYATWVREGTKEASLSLDIVDMIAFFQVLLPDVVGDLVGYKNISEIPLAKVIPFVKVYRSEFVPKFKPYLDEVYELYDSLMDGGTNPEKKHKEDGNV